MCSDPLNIAAMTTTTPGGGAGASRPPPPAQSRRRQSPLRQGNPLASASQQPRVTACDSCFRLKRKCNSDVPMCSTCARTGASCTYLRRFVSTSLVQRRSPLDSVEMGRRMDKVEHTVRSLLLGGLASAESSAGSLTADFKRDPETFANNMDAAYSSWATWPTPFPPGASNPPVLPSTRSSASSESSTSFPAPVPHPPTLPPIMQSPTSTTFTPMSTFIPTGTGTEMPPPHIALAHNIELASREFQRMFAPIDFPDSFTAHRESSADISSPPTSALYHSPAPESVSGSSASETLVGVGVVDSTESTETEAEMWVSRLDQAFSTLSWTDAPQSVTSPTTTEPSPSPILPLHPRFVFADNEMETYIHNFFKDDMLTPIPFVHHTTDFAGFARSDSDAGCNSLVLAVCAWGCARESPHTFQTNTLQTTVQGSSVLLDTPRSQQIFSAALAALDYDAPSMRMCQALLSMIIYCVFIGESRSGLGVTLLGMATGLIELLGLDVDPDEVERRGEGAALSLLEKEERRRIFYLCIGTVFRERGSNGLWERQASINAPVRQPRGLHVWDLITPTTTLADIPDSVLNLRHPTDDIIAHCISIIRLSSNIVDFNLATGSADIVAALRVAPETSRYVDQFEAINAQLMGFFEASPAHVRDLTAHTDFSLSNRIQPSAPPYYFIIKLHTAYHGAILKLHRARLMESLPAISRMLLNEDDDGSTTVTGRPDIYRSVTASARAAHELLEVVRRDWRIVETRGDRDVARHAVFGAGEASCVFDAAVHYVLVVSVFIATRGHESQVRELLLVDEADALEAVSVLWGVLRGITKRWKIVGGFVDALRRFCLAAGVDLT